jgi:hypothetical protein
MRLDRQLFFYPTQGGGKPCPGLSYFAPSGHFPFGMELLCECYGNFRPLKFLKNHFTCLETEPELDSDNLAAVCPTLKSVPLNS